MYFSYFETGDSKELYMSFDQKLDKIEIYDLKSSGEKIIVSEMLVKDMERCVRSCITEAFESNKGLFKRSKLRINIVKRTQSSPLFFNTPAENVR